MNFPKPDPGKINCCSCRYINVDGCEECRRCPGCGCACKKCYNCSPTSIDQTGERHVDMTNLVKHHSKYFCFNCGRCKRHNPDGIPGLSCVCRKRPRRVYEANEPKTTFNLNTLRRTLGLELECSYLGTTKLNIKVPHRWEHDGSITPGGMELVLGKLKGDKFIQAMSELGKEFSKYGFKVDASCGFHVHVGVDDWAAFELRRLLVLYSKFENVFYDLVAKGRDGYRERNGERKYYARRNNITPAWIWALAKESSPSSIRRVIIESLYSTRLARRRGLDGQQYKLSKPVVNHDGPSLYCPWPQTLKKKPLGFENMPTIAAHKYEMCRYFGLNLHTFFQQNTVEFRMHEGTVDTSKMIYWPLWCGWFTEIAGALTDTEVAHIQTLDQLLDSEWSRVYGKPIAFPQAVRDWVRKTLVERKAERDF